MTLELWRNLAVVWLALLCLIGMVIQLAISIFAVKGIHVVVDKLPGLLGAAKNASSRMRTATDEGSRRVVAPIVELQSRATRITTVAKRLGGRHRDQRERRQP